MPFGDKRYDEYEFNPFHVGHPWAPVTFYIGNVLRQTYAYAQRRGVVLHQQSYPYNIQDFGNDLTANRGFVSSGATTRVGVTRAWCQIPLNFTHLVCDAVFAVQSLSAAEVQHRLIARNGTGCDRSDHVVEIEATPWPSPQQQRLSRMSPEDFPYAGAFPVRWVQFDLELSNVGATPGVCQIRVEALANKTANGSTYGTPVAYQPLWYQVRAESRY
jgi:hypothetical protein